MVVKESAAFPVDVLPEPLRTFVGNSAGEMGCDAGMIALPMLVGAVAVGTTRQLEIKPGWCEPSVLWGMVVSRRGSRKSPAQQEEPGTAAGLAAGLRDADSGQSGRTERCRLDGE